MITSEDLLSLNFYKKEKFTGSYKGMRYLIQKDHEGDDDVLRVYLWPGPYGFDATDDSKKETAVFPFSLEGKQQAADFLNHNYYSRFKGRS